MAVVQGWVEQSDTQHFRANQNTLGFIAFNPTFEPGMNFPFHKEGIWARIRPFFKKPVASPLPTLKRGEGRGFPSSLLAVTAVTSISMVVQSSLKFAELLA